MTRDEFFLFYRIFSNQVPSNNQEKFQDATQLFPSPFRRPPVKDGACGEDVGPCTEAVSAESPGVSWQQSPAPLSLGSPSLEKGRGFCTEFMNFIVTVSFCDEIFSDVGVISTLKKQ